MDSCGWSVVPAAVFRARHPRSAKNPRFRATGSVLRSVAAINRSARFNYTPATATIARVALARPRALEQRFVSRNAAERGRPEPAAVRFHLGAPRPPRTRPTNRIRTARRVRPSTGALRALVRAGAAVEGRRSARTSCADVEISRRLRGDEDGRSATPSPSPRRFSPPGYRAAWLLVGTVPYRARVIGILCGCCGGNCVAPW